MLFVKSNEHWAVNSEWRLEDGEQKVVIIKGK